MKNLVAVYHRSVPNGKNPEKVNLLKYFSEGVIKAGDQAIDVNDYSYQHVTVGIIQGWIAGVPNSPHTKLRQQVIEKQLARKQYVVSADSNLFLYANSDNPHHYLRYSFNGVFPNTGIYCDTSIDSTRWEKIKKIIGLSVKDYRTNGSHILFCLQRRLGWSMDGYDLQEWVLATARNIRKHTDRPIVLRAHPGDKTIWEYLDPSSANYKLDSISNISISSPKPFAEDLKNCWAVVNYNSSPTVGAAIEGYPVFVTDPDRSQSRDIANTDLSKIETPLLPDRQRWLERLSMFHWNFNELRSGECWQHMREFI